jgi:hypothetical protein
LCVGMVELSAVTDVGIPFCNACYILEGDAPLVFTENHRLKKLDSLVRDPDKFGFKYLQEMSKVAEEIVATLLEPFKKDITDVSDDVEKSEA